MGLRHNKVYPALRKQRIFWLTLWEGAQTRNSQDNAIEIYVELTQYKLAPFRGDGDREILFATIVNRAIFSEWCKWFEEKPL